MTKQKTRSNLSVQYMTRIAILGALSAVLFPLEIPIVAFYKLDFSTLPALLGAFSMGPLPGLAILLIKDLSRLAYSSSMYVGELADFIMSAAFILPASLIYRKHAQNRAGRHGGRHAVHDCGVGAGELEDDDSVLHDRVPHGHGSDYRHGAEGTAVRGYGMEGAAVCDGTVQSAEGLCAEPADVCAV